MISWMLKGLALSGMDNGAWSVNASTVESIGMLPALDACFANSVPTSKADRMCARACACGRAALDLQPVCTVAVRAESAVGERKKCALAVRHASRMIQGCALETIVFARSLSMRKARVGVSCSALAAAPECDRRAR